MKKIFCLFICLFFASCTEYENQENNDQTNDTSINKECEDNKKLYNLALNQLDVCENNLEYCKTKKEQVEQDCNETGDLLSECNNSLSKLRNQPRSKSGSRLVYREYEYSDGSSFAEYTPYDLKLKSNCSFQQTGEYLNCCITQSREVYFLNNYNYGDFIYNNFFKDKYCTIQAGLNEFDIITTDSLCRSTKYIGTNTYKIEINSLCEQERVVYNPVYSIFSNLTTGVDLYIKNDDKCVFSKYIGYSGTKLSDEEIMEKEFFVCRSRKQD